MQPRSLPTTLPRIFEEQARRTPSAVASLAAAQQLTYAELNSQANQLARDLVDAGIGHGAIVAVAGHSHVTEHHRDTGGTQGGCSVPAAGPGVSTRRTRNRPARQLFRPR